MSLAHRANGLLLPWLCHFVKSHSLKKRARGHEVALGFSAAAMLRGYPQEMLFLNARKERDHANLSKCSQENFIPSLC